MKRTLIIAEAGVNHNGDIEIAKKLIDAASEAGADYVKFQTFKAEKLVNKNAEKAEYQKENSGATESQFEMLKKLEIDEEAHLILQNYCKVRNIKFLSTAFDLDSIYLLQKLDIDLFKIPSGEITNYPYIQKIGLQNKPIIISSGMSTLEDIQAALETLIEVGVDKNNVTILHCSTEYPTPFQNVNLTAMNTIKDTFDVKVGYSDHTLGIEIPIAAVAMGATVIEKHFTLDKTMEGPDHKASLEPNELKQMVTSIRNIEKSFGNGEKIPSETEIKNLQVARKSIHAKCDIKIGDIFSDDNLIAKRPGTGVSPMKWKDIIGTTANKNYKADDILEL
tara:strand:+ start:955 stop:1959 length:1005 start_codon:yes stop_codon:yes gene_type:complete